MWVSIIALGLLAAAFGYGLAYASKKFAVELHPAIANDSNVVFFHNNKYAKKYAGPFCY